MKKLLITTLFLLLASTANATVIHYPPTVTPPTGVPDFSGDSLMTSTGTAEQGYYYQGNLYDFIFFQFYATNRQIRVYSYKTFLGRKVFSSTYSQSASFETPTAESEEERGCPVWSWPEDTSANGYRVFFFDDSPSFGYNFDHYIDTTATSFEDGCNGHNPANYTAGTSSELSTTYVRPRINYRHH